MIFTVAIFGTEESAHGRVVATTEVKTQVKHY